MDAMEPEPATETPTEPAGGPATDPAVEPVAGPAVEPVAGPVVEPVARPFAQPAVRPHGETAVEPPGRGKGQGQGLGTGTGLGAGTGLGTGTGTGVEAGRKPGPGPGPGPGPQSVLRPEWPEWKLALRPQRRLRRLSVSRAVVASVVAAALAAGTFVALTHSGERKRPAPQPAAGAPGAASSLAALNARVRAAPRDDGAWSALGAALVERGLRAADAAYYPKAEAALKRSLAVRTPAAGNLAGMVAMARLSYAREDFAAARKWGELVHKRAPREWATYPLLIDTYGRLGDAKAAARTAEHFMEKRGGAAALGWTAQTYRDKGWREDAAALASQAVAVADSRPQKADQLVRAAELAWERGDLSESLGFYGSALALEPKQGTAVAGRARVLAALGRTDEAVRAYRTALALTPRPEYALELGELTEAITGNGDPQYGVARAQVDWDSKQGVRGGLVLGRLESDHGDAELAVDLLREEWSRRPAPEVADALGWALHRTGDDEAALEYARKVTKAGVRNALFLYHRGEIERAAGDYGAARRHLGEALRVNPAFSPLWAPRARTSLEKLGDPPEGGPRNVWGYRPKESAKQAGGAPRQEIRQSPRAPRKRR